MNQCGLLQNSNGVIFDFFRADDLMASELILAKVDRTNQANEKIC